MWRDEHGNIVQRKPGTVEMDKLNDLNATHPTDPVCVQDPVSNLLSPDDSNSSLGTGSQTYTQSQFDNYNDYNEIDFTRFLENSGWGYEGSQPSEPSIWTFDNIFKPDTGRLTKVHLFQG